MKKFRIELTRINNATQRSRPKPTKPRRQRRPEARNLAKTQKKNG